MYKGNSDKGKKVFKDMTRKLDQFKFRSVSLKPKDFRDLKTFLNSQSSNNRILNKKPFKGSKSYSFWLLKYNSFGTSRQVTVKNK